jgi:hypothetical protein
MLSYQSADTMLHQTDDAPSPSRALPPSPFDHRSPTAFKTSTAATLDLTSPSKRSRDSEQRERRTGSDRTRPTSHNRKSADEKRLIADYEYGTIPHISARLGARANSGTAYPLTESLRQTPYHTFYNRQWSRYVEQTWLHA